MKMLRRLSPLIILATVLFSCDENDYTGIPVEGDYYPLQKGNQWKYSYSQEYRCCNGNGFNVDDTITVRITEDPQPPLGYTVLHDGGYSFSKMVRKEDHQYFEYPPYRPEYAFLVDDKPVNYSWREENSNIDLTVKQTRGSLFVNGKLYSHVIEIEEMQRNLDQPDIYTESHRYFARDIGEIYSLIIYRFGNNQYDRHEMKLLNHTKP